MVNVQELIVFLAVVETGSFNRAGRRLHLSQPAVSQTIRNLEKNLKTELFVRSGRRVTLAEAGQALIPMAQELVTASKRLKETMSSLSGEVIGEFNIGCSTSAGKYILPRLIARFRSQFPHVRINVLVGDRRRVGSWLQEGRVGVGVSSKELEMRDLQNRVFFIDQVGLIVPAYHRWAEIKQITPDNLLDEPMILREEGSGTYEALVDALRQHEISPDMLNVSMTIGNAEAIEMAVAEGLGAAFISRLSAQRGLELGRVALVEVEGMQVQRNIYCVRNHNLPATRALKEFWDFVETQELDEYLICPEHKKINFSHLDEPQTAW